VKYIYIGWWIGSSNVTLPTSRLVHFLRGKGRKQPNKRPNGSAPPGRSNFYYFARLINNLAEEWYRQFVSWLYQCFGYIVLYDRHFVFEYVLRYPEVHKKHRRLPHRIHIWLLNRIYPVPDIVIFLDIPPDVAKTRKNEDPIDYLEWQRNELINHGKRFEQFVIVDGLRPIEEVCDEIVGYIMEFKTKRKKICVK